jgi:hypothetical protein
MITSRPVKVHLVEPELEDVVVAFPERPPVTVADDPLRPAGLVDFVAVDERHRVEDPGPVPDVGEELPPVDVDDTGHVRVRPRPPRLEARGEPVHGVAEQFEDGGEEAVVLVAVAAPPPSDELRAHDVERNPLVLPENDVDVLERDRLDVRAHEVSQCFRRRWTSLLPGPREVGVEIDGVEFPFPRCDHGFMMQPRP